MFEITMLKIFVTFGIPGLVLGVFFLIFRSFHWDFPKVPKQWVGPIIVIYLLLATIIIWHTLRLWSPGNYKNNSTSSSSIVDNSNSTAQMKKVTPNPKIKDEKVISKPKKESDNNNAQITGDNSNLKTLSDSINIHNLSEKLGKHNDVFSLSIFSTSEGAEIFINGEFFGLTNRTVTLPSGKHAVRISKPGYNDYSDVIIIPNQKIFSVVLEKQ